MNWYKKAIVEEKKEKSPPGVERIPPKFNPLVAPTSKQVALPTPTKEQKNIFNTNVLPEMNRAFPNTKPYFMGPNRNKLIPPLEGMLTEMEGKTNRIGPMVRKFWNAWQKTLEKPEIQKDVSKIKGDIETKPPPQTAPPETNTDKGQMNQTNQGHK